MPFHSHSPDKKYRQSFMVSWARGAFSGSTPRKWFTRGVILGLMFIPTIVFFAMGYVKAHDDLTTMALERRQEIADLTAILVRDRALQAKELQGTPEALFLFIAHDVAQTMNTIHGDPNISPYLVNQNGQAVFLAYPLKEKFFDFSSLPFVEELLRGERNVTVHFNPLSGEEVVVAYAPVEDIEWGILFVQPAFVVFAERDTMLRGAGIIYALILLLLILFTFGVMSVGDSSRTKEQALLQNIGEGVIATDQYARIIAMNPKAEKMLGIMLDNVFGGPMQEVMRIEDEKGNPLADEQNPILLALTSQEEAAFTRVTPFYMRTSLMRFPISFIATPVIMGRKVIGAVGVFRDVTQEREFDRAKDEFISIASHELNTPSGIIKWDLELLEQEGYFASLPQKARPFIEDIYRSNERMINLVKDLLSVSRITQGSVHEKVEHVGIYQVIYDLIEQQKGIAAQRSVTLDMRVDQALAPVLVGPKEFRLVMQNLIANAVKYSYAQGVVRVAAERVDGHIQISVSDQGMGIPREEQHKIFSKFFRASNVKSADVEGTGLGLFIVKSYIEQWGGTIRFESEENKGTTFFVILKLGGNIHS